jgi:hypothetical protein
MAANRDYLTAEQITGCETHYGVRVFWSGEDGDVVALTSDVRRGLAAIHALGRHELGQPVASAVAEGIQLGYARFWIADDGTDEWDTALCAAGDDGALPIVWVAEVGPYNERKVRAGCGERASEKRRQDAALSSQPRF